jgi:uncharacterized protein (DUF2235 family)
MKRLIVCSDGTWQKITSPYPTNVVKITQAIVTDPDNLVFYGEGIGTGNFIDRVMGGAFGWGIDKNIQDAYRFLCLNYAPGDEIYLFGFSRGAYTVRSLVGLIRSVGMIPRQGVRKIPQAYKIYQDAKGEYADKDETTRENIKLRDRDSTIEFRQQMAKEFGADYQEIVEITLLSCWDTVGALGIPRLSIFSLAPLINKKYQFHNTKLSSTIKSALHAVAIDENRKTFPSTPMKEAVEIPNQLTEVWFPGTHGCIGGGSKENSPLSNAALLWTIEQVERLSLGLKFDRSKIEDGVATDPTIYFDDEAKLPFSTKIRDIPPGATFHPSVAKRWQLNLKYRSENLVPFKDFFVDDLVRGKTSR